MVSERAQHRFGRVRDEGKNKGRIWNNRCFNGGMQNKIFQCEQDLAILTNGSRIVTGIWEEKCKFESLLK